MIYTNRYCFGVDLGGTTTKMGIFTNEGQLIEKWEIPTDISDDGSHILDDISASVLQKVRDNHLRENDIKGIGIGVPGPVRKMSVVDGCVNLGWGEVEVARILEEKTQLWTCAANDANAAALGELWQGNGRGCRNLMLVTIGSGIGCGIVVGGHIVEGASGAAGELGHMTVLDEEDIIGTCGCGRRGCLEQAASAHGIVKLTAKMLQETQQESTLRGIENLSAKDVFDAAKAGDALAGRVTDKVMYYLGKAIANASVVLNPQMVILAGGVSLAGEYLRAGIERYFNTLCFKACRGKTKFRLAAMGNDSGIYGAAKMMIDMYDE